MKYIISQATTFPIPHVWEYPLYPMENTLPLCLHRVLCAICTLTFSLLGGSPRGAPGTGLRFGNLQPIAHTHYVRNQRMVP